MPVLLALLSAFGYGVSNITISYPTQKLGSNLLLFLRAVGASFLIFLIWLFFLEDQNLSWNGLFLALGVSLMGYIGLLFLYKAFGIGKVGVVSPVISIHPVISTAIAVLFFNETLGVDRILAFLAILFGIILLTINFKDFKESRVFDLKSGVPFAFLTALFFGIAFSFWGDVSFKIGILSMALLVEVGNILWSGLSLLLQKLQKKEESKSSKLAIFKTDKKLLLNVGLNILGGAVGTIFQVFALNTGQISQVSVVLGTSTLFAIVLARIFLKEKLSSKAYFAIFIIFVGVAFLSVS